MDISLKYIMSKKKCKMGAGELDGGSVWGHPIISVA
jgi:hypothetical protein